MIAEYDIVRYHARNKRFSIKHGRYKMHITLDKVNETPDADGIALFIRIEFPDLTRATALSIAEDILALRK